MAEIGGKPGAYVFPEDFPEGERDKSKPTFSGSSDEHEAWQAAYDEKYPNRPKSSVMRIDTPKQHAEIVADSEKRRQLESVAGNHSIDSATNPESTLPETAPLVDPVPVNLENEVQPGNSETIDLQALLERSERGEVVELRGRERSAMVDTITQIRTDLPWVKKLLDDIMDHTADSDATRGDRSSRVRQGVIEEMAMMNDRVLFQWLKKQMPMPDSW